MHKDIIGKESTYILRNLISIHSMLNSSSSLEARNSIKNAIIKTADWFRHEVGEKEFERHIVSNDYVYCWTKAKIEKLKKIDNVILCASKSETAFNQNYESLPDKKYKYQYKLHIKKDTFGLDLSSFDYKIHKKDLSGYAYWGNMHTNEEEVLVRLDSIDIYEIISYNT